MTKHEGRGTFPSCSLLTRILTCTLVHGLTPLPKTKNTRKSKKTHDSFGGNDRTTNSAQLPCAPLAWASLAEMDDGKCASDGPSFCQAGPFEVERYQSNSSLDRSCDRPHQFLRH